MDNRETNVGVFLIAAALGAFVLTVYDAKEEMDTPPPPPAQIQEMPKQDKVSVAPAAPAAPVAPPAPAALTP